jgi:quinolinate synthase
MTAIPESYRAAGDDELTARIQTVKKRMGQRLVVLTHHYQRFEIVGLGDHTGDSYGLSRIASKLPEAEYIVFCGVRFMAEAARTLCRPEQKVYLPNPLAGCPMADMASDEQVNEAWELILKLGQGSKTIPISYMNTSTELKAFTGRNGGLICTSSNAEAAFKWAFDRGDKLLFFPDQHLGRNTARRMGLSEDQIYLYKPELQNGGFNNNAFGRAKVILWPGYCYVHTKFTKEHVDDWRMREPKVKIVVHPECRSEVVEASDAVGSTAFIVKYVESAPSGSTIAIGTELNLVSRLARIHQEKNIFELSSESCAICSNMFRTSLADLCYTVENLDQVGQVQVNDKVKVDARIALERMLEIGG